MAQKKYSQRRQPLRIDRIGPQGGFGIPLNESNKRLELVVKSDSFGSAEAVASLLTRLKIADLGIRIIHSGVGDISKSDILMALSGSRLILGFNVGIMPKLDQWLKERGVEVRLYNVIYKLTEDIVKIAQSIAKPEAGVEERILGSARVIALFKSRHRAIIIGSEVVEGVFSVGKEFRILSAMGPVYYGRIESLQVEKREVKEAKVGQQVGLKLTDFNRVSVGDQVECFETAPSKKTARWKPSGSVIHLES